MMSGQLARRGRLAFEVLHTRPAQVVNELTRIDVSIRGNQSTIGERSRGHRSRGKNRWRDGHFVTVRRVDKPRRVARAARVFDLNGKPARSGAGPFRDSAAGGLQAAGQREYRSVAPRRREQRVE